MFKAFARPVIHRAASFQDFQAGGGFVFRPFCFHRALLYGSSSLLLVSEKLTIVVL